MSELSENLTVICLGSNVADRFAIVRKALDILGEWFRITTQSEYYEFDDDSGIGAPYVNVVVGGMPLVDLATLQANIKALETDHGRKDDSKQRGVVPLDIDVVLWHGEVVDEFQFDRPYFQHGFKSLFSR